MQSAFQGNATLFCSTLLLAANPAFAAGPPATGVQQECLFEVQSPVAAKIGYLLFLPQGYEKSNQRWPLMLFLHGAQESGTNLASLKRHGPPKYVESHPGFPFILVSPQYHSGNDWDKNTLMALLDDVIGRHRVDTRRVYLTGLSMGGSATWSLAAAHPDRFAAIVPVSGVGDPADARKLAALPIWVFHGAKDTIISVEWSRKMVAAIRAEGGNVKYTEYPDARHNIWSRTYNNPGLYKWLLAQKR
jgi:predicted peptidase